MSWKFDWKRLEKLCKAAGLDVLEASDGKVVLDYSVSTERGRDRLEITLLEGTTKTLKLSGRCYECDYADLIICDIFGDPEGRAVQLACLTVDGADGAVYRQVPDKVVYLNGVGAVQWGHVTKDED